MTPFFSAPLSSHGQQQADISVRFEENSKAHIQTITFARVSTMLMFSVEEKKLLTFNQAAYVTQGDSTAVRVSACSKVQRASVVIRPLLLVVSAVLSKCTVQLPW
jgi:hypothetical protein